MRVLAMIAACVVLATAPGAFAQSAATQTAAATQPAASQTAAGQTAPAGTDYVLGPGDEVRISIYGEPDLAAEQRLGPNGDISVPLAGDIRAGGMTISQLARTLEARYEDGFLIDPQVSVTIAAFRPFYVVGEVSNPGAYPYAADLTSSTAIAFAGGFTRRADRSNIYVRRAGESQEREYASNENIPLQPGDTVRVGTGFLSTLGDLPFGWLPIF